MKKTLKTLLASLLVLVMTASCSLAFVIASSSETSHIQAPSTASMPR